MASALETFFGQAYGAKQYHMLGIHLQRAMLVLMVTFIPIAFIWSFTGHIFTICGQDMEISSQAGIYAHWLIPIIFPYSPPMPNLIFTGAKLCKAIDRIRSFCDASPSNLQLHGWNAGCTLRLEPRITILSCMLFWLARTRKHFGNILDTARTY